MATNGNINHGEQQYTSEQAAPATSPSETVNNAQKAELPRDEVGWYFVEQYYTTLSKNPEKLHLYYGKKSQFVYGPEAEVADVSLGRAAIQERIKSLGFIDCKVRISNVDAQGSGDCIVIQVIGEISNNGEEPRKFVQTFVLAQQPSGYFVLNDIFRYIKEDVEEEVAEQDQSVAAPNEPVAAPEAEVEAQPEPAEVEEAPKEQESAPLDTAAVDKKLEEAEAPAAEPSAPSAAVEPASGDITEPVEEEKVAEPTPDPETAAEEVAEEEVKQPEDPKAPTPTPAAAPAAPVAAPVAAEPEKPKEPPKPMSWASRVAAAAGPTRPAVTLPKFVPTPAQTRPPVAAAAKQPTPAAPAAEPTPAPATSQDQGNEWQTAETKRQNRAQSQASTPSQEAGTIQAYVKFVTEKVNENDLKSALSVFGELTYFDVNRAKNCAFVEFKTPAMYNAAVAANPHVVNGESCVVEARRPKANNTFGANSNFNAGRGGAQGRGRGGFETGRSGSQGGRGGFSGQTRGGRGGAPRGRGGQAGAA